MSWPLMFTGEIRDGRLYLQGIPAECDAQIRRANPGPVLLTVDRLQARRNLAQNRFLWGVVYATIAAHTGYTTAEVHEFAKQRWLGKRLLLTNTSGEIVEEAVIGGSTRQLNRMEFSDYLSAIRIWAAKTLGIEIPEVTS